MKEIRDQRGRKPPDDPRGSSESIRGRFLPPDSRQASWIHVRGRTAGS